jgi:hypothetical protein
MHIVHASGGWHAQRSEGVVLCRNQQCDRAPLGPRGARRVWLWAAQTAAHPPARACSTLRAAQPLDTAAAAAAARTLRWHAVAAGAAAHRELLGVKSSGHTHAHTHTHAMAPDRSSSSSS